MRARWLALGLSCVLAASASAQEAKRPLVMELFTSQGCSSCPPADRLVADVAQSRPDILALTFHVTYWNSLGWTDPFSLPAATERQQRYVAASVSPEVYTPAMVLEGLVDVVGSDRPAVVAAIARAKAEQRTDAAVTVARTAGGVAIAVGAGVGQGTVLLLGYDRRHETRVGRGENSGRTLVEANIVRSVSVAGHWTGGSLQLTAAAPAGEAVAVLVQADNGRILGAARLDPASDGG